MLNTFNHNSTRITETYLGINKNHAVNEMQCDSIGFPNHSSSEITEKYLSLNKKISQSNEISQKISDAIYYHSPRIPKTYHVAKGDRRYVKY